MPTNAGNTARFGFTKVGRNDSLQADGYKALVGDRDLLDTILRMLEVHTHSGETFASHRPTLGPTLSLDTAAAGGVIPAGRRLYYVYTIVDPSGLESPPSPEVYADTPSAIAAPAAPIALTTVATGGTLLPGEFFYVLSAYKDQNTAQTLPSAPVSIAVPVGTATNRNSFALPAVPVGATGFNVYRRRIGGGYYWLAQIDMTVATPPTTFVDDGSYTEDCNRPPPTKNLTNAQNAITVLLPGATPYLPSGYTWKVYRSTTSGVYENRMLHHVVEETSEGSGVIAVEYLDLGYRTSTGTPPTVDIVMSPPPKNILTDGASVEGTLPMGLVSGFPFPLTVIFPGAVEVAVGQYSFVWPFPAGTIIGVQLALGPGRAPASTPLIVDVNRKRGVGANTTIYTDQADRPRIPVGDQAGGLATPAVLDVAAGDLLTVDVDQAGGGATPNDYNLTIVLWFVASGFPAAVSFVPGTTTGSGA